MASAQFEEEMWAAVAALSSDLRAARQSIPGLTQARLGALLAVTARTVREWEASREHPTMHHLIRWCHELGFRLLVVEYSGTEPQVELAPRAGESWAQREARRVAAVLKGARVRRSVTQKLLATRLGISLASMKRWESAAGHPRALGLFRWAGFLEYSIQLGPIKR